MRIAIPRFQESVAPCFEHTSTVTIFTVHRKRILSQEDFVLKSREGLDRVRLLRDQNVDVLICGGLQESYENMLTARGIRVYSWVSGNVQDLLDQFLQGKLEPGSARLHTSYRAREPSIVAKSSDPESRPG